MSIQEELEDLICSWNEENADQIPMEFAEWAAEALRDAIHAVIDG